jgi:hypothetical protein
VLVCPELRALALARLPDRDPDGFLPPRYRPKPVAAPPAVSSSETMEASPGSAAGGPKADRRSRLRELAVDALVHAAGQVVVTAAIGTAIVAGLTGLVLLVAALR